MSTWPAFDRAPARVLIVDDVRANRDVLEIMLAPEGHHLQTAASGEEALAMVAREPPDLILLDVMMPGIDGYQVAASLKSDPATKHIPIIMVTALSDRPSKIAGLTAGAEDFLTKPVDRAELYMRVRNLLRLKAYGDYHDKYGQLLEVEVERRDAELLESESLYLSTFEEAPIGIVHVGLDGQWRRVNKRLCELLRYSKEELQTVAIQKKIESGDGFAKDDSFRQLVAGAMDRHQFDERRYARGDGTVMWARVGMSVHRDAQGKAQHVITVIEDITEQKRAELLAQKEERKFRRFVETSHEGIAILDAETRFSFVNERLETMFGYEEGELLGKPALVLVPALDGASAEESLERRRQGVVESGELRLQRKDGTEVWVLRSSHPIESETGEHEGTYSTLMDVTERKHAQDSLRKSEQQLRQSHKMEAVGGLAAGIAHDFNNLLSVILSYSHLIAADLKDGDPMRPDLQEIHDAAVRAADLTRRLLAFSRQQVLQPQIVNLSTVVDGMQTMLKRVIGADVDLSVTHAPALGEVVVDPSQIEQIVVNLVVNARDAMPSGGKVTIETAKVVLDEVYAAEHPGVKPGPHVMLVVSDTGTGMTAATQARIFDPFFTTKEVGKGTGLGLAIVFGIVQQSGGSISVYSERGKGTTFKIYFPRADGAAVAIASVRPVPSPTLRGSETVLLVEDDERVRAVTRTILRKYGYTVLDAQSAGDACLLSEQHSAAIQLLLTDIVMPRMSGTQLAHRLRIARPEMKVLYMSGYTDDAVLQNGILDWSVAFLQKPITPEALARKVREALGSLTPGGS